ncbi:MAG: HIT family protein [Candidatus Bipolaricaulia bacterium]
MDCPFCRIVSHEAPAHIIYEDERTIAFLDINPVSRGHTLVIPKGHYHDLFELPSEELQAVTRAAQRVARAIKAGLGAEGLNLLQSNGSAAGQVVFHFHLHLIPRYSGDGLRLGHRGDYRERDFPETARRIREAL